MDIKYLLEQNDNALDFLRAVKEKQSEDASEDWDHGWEDHTEDRQYDEWREAVAESNRVFGDDETWNALDELRRR